ncbi:MAG: outer membrane beta-barrel protein [Tenacibaculum sp.]
MKLFKAFLLLFIFSNIYSQNLNEIEGTVFLKEKAIDLANITLLYAKDSSFVSGSISNEKGFFKLKNIEEGNYLLDISHVSIKRKSIKVYVKNLNINLGKIEVEHKTNMLEEVVVKSSKPLYIKKKNRLIIDIKESAISATNLNANELIRNLPGVWIGRNGNIKVRGQDNTLVTVNGKSNYLSGDNLLNFLKSIPSNTIDKIELIDNPSAKYDAESSAIINIKTNTNIKQGFKGTVSLLLGESLGYDSFNPKINSGLNLSYGTDKVSIFGDYGYQYDKSLRLINERLQFPTSILNQSIKVENIPEQSHSIQSGISYNISNNKSINLFYNKSYTDTETVQDNTINLLNESQPNSIIKSDAVEFLKSDQAAFNLEYNQKIDSINTLTLSSDYLTLDKTHLANYKNLFEGTSDENLRNNSITDIKVLVFEGSYNHHFNKNNSSDIGVKYSNIKTKNRVDFEELNGNQWVLDINRSNQFSYKENIFATYINYETTIGKLNISGGLRYEDSKISGNSLIDSFQFDRSFSGFFPSASLNYSISKKLNLGLFYSRKIKRPKYVDINPFIYYLNPFTALEGNPSLTPSITNKIQLNAQINQKYSTSLTYYKTNDIFTMAQFQNVNSREQRLVPTNIGNLSNIELNAGLPLNLFSWWNSYIDLSIYYQEYKENPSVNLGFFSNSKTTFQFFTQNDFSLPHNISLELTGTLVTPSVQGQFSFSSIYFFSLGFKKSFLNNKLDLKIGFKDFLKTLKYDINLKGVDWESDFSDISDSRQLNVSLTYNFYSKGKVKTKRANWISDDEKKRMK